MLEGMTGFAQMQGVVGGVKIGIELRSYNHRYLDVVVNAPNGFSVLEEKIRGLLKKAFARGRLILNIHVNHYSGGEVVVNEALMKKYLSHVRRMSKKLKIKDDLSIRDFLHMPGAFSLHTKSIAIKQEYWSSFERILCQAVRQLKAMRLSEGRATFADLMMRLKILIAQTEIIKKRAKATIKTAKKRFAPDEISVYLKTTDINEELARLGLHLKNFKRLLANSHAIVKGKELDFIAQELQREANTIAAKSQDYKISECVVRSKAEIEKLREQLQNIQ